MRLTQERDGASSGIAEKQIKPKDGSDEKRKNLKRRKNVF